MIVMVMAFPVQHCFAQLLLHFLHVLSQPKQGNMSPASSSTRDPHAAYALADPLVQHHQLVCDSAAADWLPGHHPYARSQKGFCQVHLR